MIVNIPFKRLILRAVGQIDLDAHPESFRLEAHGPKIFVNLPGFRKVAVVDRRTKSVVARWGSGGAFANYPMALDESNHRLFIVCRMPARLVVLDTDSGNLVGKWSVVGDCDDNFYDAATKRIYASGGEGQFSVFQQQDANQYRQIASIATRKGARTSLFSPESRSLYVAARRQGPRVPPSTFTMCNGRHPCRLILNLMGSIAH